MLDPFAQLFQHYWGHARSLRMVYKDLWIVSFPRCTAGPNIVGSYCIRLHTTANNTAAKRLRMRQVEHFRSLFQSHFPVKVSRALHSVCSCGSVCCSALCCSCFDYFVNIEIAFMDNQAQITETISRLDSEKVR